MRGGDNNALSSQRSAAFRSEAFRSASSCWAYPDWISDVKCSSPFTQGGHAFGCGQCMACRFNRRRVWAHRLMLEATQHGDNCFATLTYDDEFLPRRASLEPKHLQDFLKRLRGSYAPARFRFYGCGEYGDIEFRPHYHLALFGFPSCRHGRTRIERRTGDCCVSCDLVRRSWGMGIIMLGTLESFSAQYIAGYVTKKMTDRYDERLRLEDGSYRYPEFARMSNRPGIGARAMDEVASELMRFNLDKTQADVPFSLRHGKRELPLGRYLRAQLRKRIGKDEKTPKVVQLERSSELMPLVQESVKNVTSFKTEVLKRFEGERNSFESRRKIFKQRRKM